MAILAITLQIAFDWPFAGSMQQAGANVLTYCIYAYAASKRNNSDPSWRRQHMPCLLPFFGTEFQRSLGRLRRASAVEAPGLLLAVRTQNLHVLRRDAVVPPITCRGLRSNPHLDARGMRISGFGVSACRLMPKNRHAPTALGGAW